MNNYEDNELYANIMFLYNQINDNDFIKQKDIAAEIGISPQSLSGYLRAYEDKNQINMNTHSANLIAKYVARLKENSGTNEDAKAEVKIDSISSPPDESGSSPQECECQLEEIDDTTNEKDSLINIFETAIDKHGIQGFIDYDLNLTPLTIRQLELISDFIWKLREAILKYRHDPKSASIKEFVNFLEEYIGFIGLQMASEDGERFYRLKTIDLEAVQKTCFEYREKLNEIYGAISGGGTLSVYR